MFDLTALDTREASNEGFDVEIINPATQEGTGFIITVLGEDSDAYQKVATQQQQRRLKRAISNRRTELSVDELDHDSIELIAACTKAWRMKDGADVAFQGKPLTCNIANATTIYERMPVVRKQVEAAISDRANFMPRSASH